MARILCVDDHTYALSGTIAALQHEGHTILTINGRNPALQAVADDEVVVLFGVIELAFGLEQERAVRAIELA